MYETVEIERDLDASAKNLWKVKSQGATDLSLKPDNIDWLTKQFFDA